jgi:hypothetical protein
MGVGAKAFGERTGMKVEMEDRLSSQIRLMRFQI